MVQENHSATFVDSQLLNISYYKATCHVHVALSETVITNGYLGISHQLFREEALSELFSGTRIILIPWSYS